MVNFIAAMKEKHSKKPAELYDMVEHCSPSPFLELFARVTRKGWTQWGDEIQTKEGSPFLNEDVSPRPMEDGMIRPYRFSQFLLIR